MGVKAVGSRQILWKVNRSLTTNYTNCHELTLIFDSHKKAQNAQKEEPLRGIGLIDSSAALGMTLVRWCLGGEKRTTF